MLTWHKHIEKTQDNTASKCCLCAMHLKRIKFHQHKEDLVEADCSSVSMRSLLKLKSVADEQVFYDEFVNMTSALNDKLAR